MGKKSDRHGSLHDPLRDPLLETEETSLVHKPSTGITPQSAEKLLCELQVHQAELEMQNRLTRAFKLLIECSKLLSHTFNEQELLEKVCQLTVETGGYLMAWVGFAENDAEHTVRPVAQSGYEDGYLGKIKVTWSDTVQGQGPIGTAIKTRTSTVNLDCLNNSKMASWREEVIERGYQSTIALPLVSNNLVIGALTIYAAEPHAFIGEEVTLLEVLANDLAFSIHSLRTKAEYDEALAALQLSEQRYQSMLDAQTEVICRFKTDNTVLYVNDAFCRLFGKQKKELIGYKWQPIAFHEDLPLIKEKLDTLSPTNPVVTIENRIICADGEIRWGQFVNRAFYDTQNNLKEVQAVGRDITEHKNLENALITSEREFRLLAEAMPQIVWITRPDGWNIYFNQQWVAYTGLSLEESYGHGWNKPFHSDDQQRAWDAWLNAVNNNGTYSLESRLRRADGEYRWWLIRGIPVLDEAGNIYKWFGTCTDIHDIKETENDLKIAALTVNEIMEKNQKLTLEISRRNFELSSLTTHIQKIEEAERARLARELHDELGSVLIGIIMEVGRLKGKITDAAILQDLALIKDLLSKAIQAKQGVINQLYPTVLEDFGLIVAAEWLVNEFKHRSGLAVELVVPEDNVTLDQSVALATYRITQECLTNIAKHAGATRIHVEIKISDECLDLIIHDNGKGLLNNKNKKRHGILGMIERATHLGGSMVVESKLGKGTTAHLILPLKNSKSKNKKRVLVVDDHAIIRNAIRQLIASETDDFSVEGEADDGISAIQMAFESEWDIMLLDISLPKKSGISVLEEIKAEKPNLPVIMLSGHSHDEYAELSLSKGAAYYLEKSDTDKLIEAMRQATTLQ